MEKLMSIRKYVHQVRPIQEGFLEPAIKIQKFLSYLSEATMSIAQLKKRDNLNVLKDLIDNKKPPPLQQWSLKRLLRS